MRARCSTHGTRYPDVHSRYAGAVGTRRLHQQPQACPAYLGLPGHRDDSGDSSGCRASTPDPHTLGVLWRLARFPACGVGATAALPTEPLLVVDTRPIYTLASVGPSTARPTTAASWLLSTSNARAATFHAHHAADAALLCLMHYMSQGRECPRQRLSRAD